MPFSVPYTFVPFTTIYSAQVNSNFSHLVNDGNTHEVATTGVHGVGVGQIVGTALTQTLTNKTINGGALTGTFTGTPAYSGRPIFSVGLTVPTTQTISLNVGATSRITESSADTIQIITGGTLGLQIDGSNVSLGNRALAIQSAQRFYLDGGSDTYLTEDAANEIQIVTNGANALRINHTSTGNINVQGRALTIDSGQRFYLDGGGDTYLTEPSANNIQIVTAGTESGTFNSSGLSMNGGRGLFVQSGDNVGFDGASGNTAFDEVSADNLRAVIGGNDALRMQRASSTRVNFGFNGNGTNPETLFSGADVVIGNVTDAASHILVIQSDSSHSCAIEFSDTVGTAPGGLIYSHAANSLSFLVNNSLVSEFNSSGELSLPDRSSPSSKTYMSRRSASKAWGYIIGGTATIVSSFNCASVTRSAAGQYLCNFSTNVGSNFCATVSLAGAFGAGTTIYATNAFTNHVGVNVINNAGTFIDADFFFEIHSE